MKAAALAGALSLAVPAAFAASRDVSAGLEHLHFRTGATALNRDDILGLGDAEDLLRGGLTWRESRGPFRAVFRGLAERRFGAADDTSLVLRESYVQWSGVAGSVRVGKQRVAWGSGFAWNPTNRLEAPKNPLNTSLEQEGVWAVRGEWTPTAAVGLTLVAARVETRRGDLPIELADEPRRDGAAARVRLLVEDTDVALVVALQESRDPLFGLDLARSLGGNVAAHVEAALYGDSELSPPRVDTFVRVAAGLLYTRGEQAFALEYFHNGEGYGDGARAAWLDGLAAAYRAATEGPPTLQLPARVAYATGILRPYEGLGLTRDALHASWTRSRVAERWGLSLRAVASITDGGVALTPGVSYSPGDRVTFQVDGLVLAGPPDSEYRLSPARGGVVTRVRVAF